MIVHVLVVAEYSLAGFVCTRRIAPPVLNIFINLIFFILSRPPRKNRLKTDKTRIIFFFRAKFARTARLRKMLHLVLSLPFSIVAL
jgi:hypothetical protein